MGFGFTSREYESGSVFGAAVCNIQAGNRYIVSLPLVLKDTKKKVFHICKPSIPKKYAWLFCIPYH